MLEQTSTTLEIPSNLDSTHGEVLRLTNSLSEPRNYSSHFVLTGKGGCGKSMVAGFIAEYISRLEAPVVCIDADPINNTLAGIEILKAEVADILIDEAINGEAMDTLISKMTETQSNYIIDAGASGFVPLSSFMMRDKLFELLAHCGKRLYVHAVIQGGEGIFDTATGLADMLNQFPDCVSFVAWLNPFPSKLVHNGVSLEETGFWKTEIEPRCKVVRIEELNTIAHQTFRKMLTSRRTFSEVMVLPSFNAVERYRLSQIWDRLYKQMAKAFVVGQ